MNNYFYHKYKDFSIEVILQQNERVILIKCKYSEENKYSSAFNLENLKNIDRLFDGSPPLQLSEAYNTLCKYFIENSASIIEISNSQIIIGIEKHLKQNIIFKLKREKNNNNNNKYDDKNINMVNNFGNMHYDIKKQMFNNNYNGIINISTNRNKHNCNSYMNCITNVNNYNNEYCNPKMNNIYNNFTIYNKNNNNSCNEKMNNSYNTKNNSNINICKIGNEYNNELTSNMDNKEMKNLEITENLGGADNKNLNNINSFIKDNIPFYQNYNNFESNNNYLYKKQREVSPSFNVRIAQSKYNYIDGPLKDLNCLLKFLLLQNISNKIENISNFENCKEIEEILKLFKNKKDIQIQENNNSKEGNNILDYLKYLDNMDLDLHSLIDNLFKEKQELKNEIINYWKYLSKYEEYNNDFEHKLFEDLKNCHLDYSIEEMNILERDNPEEYEQKKKKCKNMKKMILYHISEINSDSDKLNMELAYSNKTFYHKGYYFSDSIDYILIYQNNENIPNIGESFSLMACEIFYDDEKLEDLDISLSNSSQNNISNEEAKIKPDGIIKVKKCYLNDNSISKRIISTEYILSEKYQIFPLYNFTLRRNEYYVLYRDSNFIGKNIFSKNLKNIVLKSLKYSINMNFYFISSTEEALKLLLNKKKEKVILITSIRDDKSGKRFVEIARKILNFELIVLFYSNDRNHLNWIKDFPNCLYTNKSNIYEEYISNYKEVELKELKKKVEDKYDIKLKNFTFDFLCYSNCDVDESSSYFDFNSNCPYFRRVYIFNPNKNLYISMTNEGKVKKSKEKCLWEITLFDNDITFFSNGRYLDIDKNKEIAIGSKDMKKWHFDKIDDNCYYFINTEEGNNDYLSIEDDGDIRVNKKDHCKNSIFQLKDDI